MSKGETHPKHFKKSEPTFWIFEKGDMRIKFFNFFLEAKYVAPPLPIDLPTTTVLSPSGYNSERWVYKSSAFSFILFEINHFK